MTDPATLLALAERCEAADASEQRELLWEAFLALQARPDDHTPGVKEWSWLWNRFNLMTGAEAYESAAMMLVPEGYGVKVRRWVNGRGAAGCYPSESADDWHNAATPALALCAAALRARAGGGQ